MDRISNRHSNHRFAFYTFGAVVYELKVAFLRTGNPLNSHLWVFLILQFLLRKIWAKITCNCDGNCPEHNGKPIGTAITCHALDGTTIAPKTCLSDVLSKTLPYGTTFASVSALSPEKSSKDIQTYTHDLSPLSIHCVDSGSPPSALSLHIKKKNYLRDTIRHVRLSGIWNKTIW